MHIYSQVPKIFREEEKNIMQSQFSQPKQHPVFKLVSNNETSSNKRMFEFPSNIKQKFNTGCTAITKTKEAEQLDKLKDSERLSSLHQELHREADKIWKWKANTEMEIKQKDRKIQEGSTTIESLRKSVLELQLENESLSLKLQEEKGNQEEIQKRIQATREICNYLKEHNLGTELILQQCKKEKDELQLQKKDHLLKYEELLNTYKTLEISTTKERKDLIDQLKSEKSLRQNSEKEMRSKIQLMQIKLKDLMDQCDEKDIEIRDIKSQQNKNESKIYDLNELTDNLNTQLTSTQDNLHQAQSCLLQSEKNLSSLKDENGVLEQRIFDITEKFKEKIASEECLKEKLDNLKKSQKEENEVLNCKIQNMNEIISQDKKRITDLEALHEKRHNAVEDLKSARDMLIMEKCEVETKLCQLMNEKTALELSQMEGMKRANELESQIYNMNNDLETLKISEEKQKEAIIALNESCNKLRYENSDFEAKWTETSHLLREKCAEEERLKREIKKMQDAKSEMQTKWKEADSICKSEREKIHNLMEEKKKYGISLKEMQSDIEQKSCAIEKLQELLNQKEEQHFEKIEEVLKAEREARDYICCVKQELDIQLRENTKLKAATEEQGKVMHGKSKEKERLETRIKTLKEDNTSKNKQMKELEKEIKSMKSKVTTQTKIIDSKEEEVEKLTQEIKELLEDQKNISFNNQELAKQVTREQKAASQAAKEVKEMRKELEKMEIEKAASIQNCDFQIKEMTDTLAKYQKENSKVVSQKDEEIEILKNSVKKMKTSQESENNKANEDLQKEAELLRMETGELKKTIKKLAYEKEELYQQNKIAVANFEEGENSKVKELEELQRKFAEVTTKDLVSTSMQTSPLKDSHVQGTPKVKQNNVNVTPKHLVATKLKDKENHAETTKSSPNRNLNSTTPNVCLTPKTCETPSRPSAYVTPSRSTLKTPQRSILKPGSFSTSVIKKRRVAFASTENYDSDAESSSSEMMEVEMETIDSQYKDKSKTLPLLLKASPKITPNLYLDVDEEKGKQGKKTVSASLDKLALNRVPRAPPVPKHSNSQLKAENVRNAPVKPQGKFFKSSPKERSQKSKLSSMRKQKEESWFDLDSVFGFED